MIHIDLNKLILDPKLADDLNNACASLAQISGPYQKNAFIEKKKNQDLWRATLGSLAKLTSNSENDCKCWYCECDGSAGFHFQVDHFRPKKRVKNKGYKKDEFEPGYWWLAFEPKNYRISCERCNTGAGKKDQFPLAEGSSRAIFPGGEGLENILLLDPTSARDPDLLAFTQDGNVYAVPDCFDEEKRKVEVSITVYNLRARSKLEGRRNVWQKTFDLVIKSRKVRDELRQSLLLSPQQKMDKLKEFQEAYTEIKKMTLINAKFSSTAKSCIREYYKIERARAQQERLEFDLDWLLPLM